MPRFISAFVYFTFLLSFQSAYACSCGVGGYWVSEFVDDKVVFEGKVLQTKWLNEEANERRFGNNAETRFKITNTFRGQVISNASVQHHSQGAACGMFYMMGDEPLVIAYTDKIGIMRSDSCTSNAVPEITLFDYFENNVDVYIPIPSQCPDEQISNKNDPKNCHFWSDEAEAQRRKAMSKRWSEKREKALEKKKKTN